MAAIQSQADRQSPTAKAKIAHSDPRWAPFGGRARLRRDPFVKAIALDWRRLTDSGAPTLIACSGGADSTALAVALAATSDEIILAHILHDMRPAAEAEADRDSVATLAGRLGFPFLEGRAAVRGSGENAEGKARQERYKSLAVLAKKAGCPFVATGHHADDQWETLLMAVLRGAGPDAMRGVAERRHLTPKIELIRPMLATTKSACCAFLTRWEIAWCEDATNADSTRLRSALRHGVIPQLEALRPGTSVRAARTARLVRDAAGLVQEQAKCAMGGQPRWARDTLRSQRASVVATGLRARAVELLEGNGADRLGGRVLDGVVRAIRDEEKRPRRFAWAKGVVVHVTSREVWLTREAPAARP